MRKRDARRWSNCDTIKFSNLKFEVSNLKSTMLTFANFFTGGQFIGVGILLVIISVLLRRSITRSKSRQPRDVVREVHDDFRKAESTYSGRLNQMEVRLHDFTREVEGRIQTRLALLDRLILDADREIDRLENLLLMARPSSSPGPDIITLPTPSAPATLAVSPPTEPDTLEQIYALADAGHTADDIADRVGLPAGRIVLVLNLRRASRRDAA